ncbi:hypothetical protein [Micromonospora echinofusca]|uniref:hypothetical protein n=1 Tax=Micromonospora echinofusca TaxID=47858 RepID=UPI001AD6E2C0|nr:hypothetical protein [Micromonospora echinofusca]
MFIFVATVLLYVFGFVFLYGVIRLAVRHGIEDVESRRSDTPDAARSTARDTRALV